MGWKRGTVTGSELLDKALQLKLKRGLKAALDFSMAQGFPRELMAYALIGGSRAVSQGLAPALFWSKNK